LSSRISGSAAVGESCFCADRFERGKKAAAEAKTFFDHGKNA
jgi:hypothetical protein